MINQLIINEIELFLSRNDKISLKEYIEIKQLIYHRDLMKLEALIK